MLNDKISLKADYHKLIQFLERRWLSHKDTETLDQLIERGIDSYRFTHDVTPKQLLAIRQQLNIDLTAFINQSRDCPAFVDCPWTSCP